MPVGVDDGVVVAVVEPVAAFPTPELLGGTNGLLIGNAISDQFTIEFNWPLGCALAIAMLLIALVVYWMFGRLLRLVAQ